MRGDLLRLAQLIRKGLDVALDRTLLTPSLAPNGSFSPSDSCSRVTKSSNNLMVTLVTLSLFVLYMLLFVCVSVH